MVGKSGKILLIQKNSLKNSEKKDNSEKLRKYTKKSKNTAEDGSRRQSLFPTMEATRTLQSIHTYVRRRSLKAATAFSREILVFFSRLVAGLPNIIAVCGAVAGEEEEIVILLMTYLKSSRMDATKQGSTSKATPPSSISYCHLALHSIPKGIPS